MNIFQKRMLAAALNYADMGWPVLPVAKQSKRPLIQGGSRAASCDKCQIKEWLQQFSSANIGVTTGPESGFFVIDIDQSKGKDGLESLQAHFGDDFDFNTESHLYALTPTGGVHLLFKWCDGVRNAQGVIDDVDIRGEGGYIVVEPSARYIDSKWAEYQWNDLSKPICEVLPWVDDLLALRDASCNSAESTGHFDIAKVITGISEGERDSQLFRFACLLRAQDIPIELAVGFVREAAARCLPPFDPDIAEQKVTYAYSKYPSPKERTRKIIDQIKQKKVSNNVK